MGNLPPYTGTQFWIDDTEFSTVSAWASEDEQPGGVFLVVDPDGDFYAIRFEQGRWVVVPDEADDDELWEQETEEDRAEYLDDPEFTYDE